jgi:thiamine-phosphate pyrophosphorylase
MEQKITLPRVYPILQAEDFGALNALLFFARELAAGGAKVVQYRNKSGDAREMLSQLRELRRILPREVKLIVNDRADLCMAADCEGVHVGQDDLSPAGARQVVGAGRWVGFSTHNPAQVNEAEHGAADYIAVGPVFATASKQNPDPVIGLDGVRQARRLTRKPLVAIGGISQANCREVLAAGADCVALISALRKEPRKQMEELMGLGG